MSEPKSPNGLPEPSAEQLTGIATLAQALGTGSAKLCEVLLLVFGSRDGRQIRANQIDRQLQPLVAELAQEHSLPPTNPN